MDDEKTPAPHPAFARHLTDAIYVDEGGDEPGWQQALKALDLLIKRFGEEPELDRQRTDLASWTNEI